MSLSYVVQLQEAKRHEDASIHDASIAALEYARTNPAATLAQLLRHLLEREAADEEIVGVALAGLLANGKLHVDADGSVEPGSVGEPRVQHRVPETS